MTHKIVLEESEEGWSAHVPGLPGCWSQGDTEAEALENVGHVIREYLQARDELVKGEVTRQVEVTV